MPPLLKCLYPCEPVRSGVVGGMSVGGGAGTRPGSANSTKASPFSRLARAAALTPVGGGHGQEPFKTKLSPGQSLYGSRLGGQRCAPSRDQDQQKSRHERLERLVFHGLPPKHYSAVATLRTP